MPAEPTSRRVLHFALREGLGPLLIVVWVTAMYGELLTGAFPVSHDHPAHLFNAWLTSDVLLPSGRLAGWSELWFAGYPANELYGPGGNLWVALFRALTLGALDIGTTYGIAIFALLLLVPLSTYALGRAFLGRVAGSVAGLLVVVTRGGWYDLGWFWIVEMGVWPFALGAALTLLSLVVLRRYLRRGGPRGLAVASLAIQAAVVGHPMSLLLLGIAAPLVVLHVVLERGRAGATRVLVRAASAAALGASLCAFWLLPFIARSSYTQRLGETWMELRDAWPGVAQLDLFGPEWRLVFGLAMVGVLFAMARRNVWALYLVTTGVLMALFASATTQYELRLFDVLSPLASIQFPRFLGVVRVFVYLLCGYAVGELCAMWRPGWTAVLEGTVGERVRAATVVALPLLLIVPLAPAALDYFDQNHVPHPESLRTQREHPWWDDYQQAAQWVAEELEDEPFSRVGGLAHPSEHVLATLPIYTGLPVFTGGYVPAHTYRYFFGGDRDVDTLRAVGVRYVVAVGAWGDALADAKERARFGQVGVYELDQYSSRRVSTLGECTVEEVEITEQRMLVRVTDVPGDSCRLRLHRSDFPNWRATFDGAPVPIERIASHRGASDAPFMSVEVTGEGTLEVLWTETTGDRVGVVTSAVAWPLWLLLLGLGARRRVWDRVRRRFPRPPAAWRRWGARAIWLVVGIGLIGGAVAATSRAGEVTYTFDRHFHEARVEVHARGEWLGCPAATDGPGRVCGEGWDRARVGLFSYTYDSRYCVYAHPSPLGPKRFVFEDVPLQNRLSGFYGLLDTSQGTGEVKMSVAVDDGVSLELVANKIGEARGFEMDTKPGRADVTITVTAQRPQWRHLCFNLQVMP